MITGVQHTGLTVSDMRRALTFSRDLLGLEVDPRRTVRIRGQMVSRMIGVDNCELGLVMLNAGPATRIQLEEFKSPVGTVQENLGVIRAHTPRQSRGGRHPRPLRTPAWSRGVDPVARRGTGALGFGEC